MNMNKKKICKSRTNRKIAGVCGGIAEFFDIDPTWVRLGLVLLSLGGGSGVLAYIAAALIMPDPDYTVVDYRDSNYNAKNDRYYNNTYYDPTAYDIPSSEGESDDSVQESFSSNDRKAGM